MGKSLDVLVHEAPLRVPTREEEYSFFTYYKGLVVEDPSGGSFEAKYSFVPIQELEQGIYGCLKSSEGAILSRIGFVMDVPGDLVYYELGRNLVLEKTQPREHVHYIPLKPCPYRLKDNPGYLLSAGEADVVPFALLYKQDGDMLLNSFTISEGNIASVISGVCEPVPLEDILSDAVPAFKKETNLTDPKVILSYLNDYVIGQYEAKRDVAVAVANYRLRAMKNGTWPIEHILLVGPTGVGKTEICRTIARMLDIPFVRRNASRLTESGIVGDDVKSIVLEAARDTESVAPFAVCMIDEVDKLATKWKGANVMNEFLDMLEGDWITMNYSSNHDRVTGGADRFCPDKVSSENVLFIFAGAFHGEKWSDSLEEILSVSSTLKIGFGGEEKRPEKSLNEKVQDKSLIDYGFKPEFVGRIPIRAVLEELTENELRRILTEKKDNIVGAYKDLFKHRGYELIFRDETAEVIASYAPKDVGARGLAKVCAKLFREILLDLSEQDCVIDVTPDLARKYLDPD